MHRTVQWRLAAAQKAIFFYGLLVAIAVARPWNASAVEKPNIIIILVDDK
jgi:hypothetical protein